MQPNLRHYADYFSICLWLGLCSVDEVIAWVDQLIEETDFPSNWMIELSTSADKHLLDVIHLLALVPGDKDLDITRGNVFEIYLDLDCVEDSHVNWSVLEQDYEALLAVGQPFRQWINFQKK